MSALITIVLLLLIPFLLKRGENLPGIKWLGAIAWCYIIGIGISALPIPTASWIIKEVTEVSIALSVSILVLSSRFDQFKKLAGSALTAFFLGILSLTITLFIVFYAYGKNIENGPTILAMLSGVYVGGTPNLNAIGLALGVSNETLVLVNTAEFFFGGIYFLLLLTVVKPFLSLFLRKYRPVGDPGNVEEEIKYDIATRSKNVSKILFLSVVILGVSFLINTLIFDQMNVSFFLITLTTLSILVAQHPKVKPIPLKYETADFLLLIFSFGIGLQIDISQLFQSGVEIYLLVGSVLLGTILIHFFLAYITGTDADTLIISSTAALYGPPFIAPISKAIENRELVIYGITLGLLGYIIGNYLGLGLSWIFESLL